jgi:hypothetical protein
MEEIEMKKKDIKPGRIYLNGDEMRVTTEWDCGWISYIDQDGIHYIEDPKSFAKWIKEDKGWAADFVYDAIYAGWKIQVDIAFDNMWKIEVDCEKKIIKIDVEDFHEDYFIPRIFVEMEQARKEE